MLAGWPRGRGSARKDLAAAQTLFARLIHRHPRAHRYQSRLAATHNALGVSLNQSDPPRAVQEYDQAINLMKKLVREHAHIPEYREELALAERSRGILLYRYAAAGAPGEPMRAQTEADLSHSTELLARLAIDYVRTVKYREEHVNSRSALGSFYRDSGQAMKSLKTWREAFDDIDRLPPV